MKERTRSGFRVILNPLYAKHGAVLSVFRNYLKLNKLSIKNITFPAQSIYFLPILVKNFTLT